MLGSTFRCRGAIAKVRPPTLWLGLLVPETNLADLPRERDLRVLGTWSANEQAELGGIEEQLMRDPQVLIRLRTDAKQALDIVRQDVSRLGDGLADAAIAATRRAKQEVDTTRRAARSRGQEPLQRPAHPGSWVGHLAPDADLCSRFRGYHIPGRAGPRSWPALDCVFFATKLSTSLRLRASSHLTTTFPDEPQKRGVAAARVFSEHQASLMAVRVRSRREVETLLAGYTELSVRGRDSVARISAFFDNAEQRLGAVTRAIREDRYDSLDALDPMPPSPGRFIEDEIARLDAEIAELERVERDEAGLGQASGTPCGSLRPETDERGSRGQS